MNQELKALLDIGLASFKAGKDAVERKDFVTVLLPDLYGIASKVPAVAANWQSLQAEVAALSGSEQEKDLIAYVMTRLPEVSDNAKAARIVAASLNLAVDVVQRSLELKAAIES